MIINYTAKWGTKVNEVNKKTDIELVTTWPENRMLLNPSKCHSLYLGCENKKDEFSFDGKIFENSEEKTILGINKALLYYF